MKFLSFITLLSFGSLSGLAQLGSPTPSPASQNDAGAYQRVILKNNAIDLAREVGKRSSELPVRQRLELRLNTAIVLFDYDVDTAVNLLDGAWKDIYSEEIKNESYVNSQRKRILAAANKIAPDKAKKWLSDITIKKTEDENTQDKTQPVSQRQQADLILRSLITNLSANPEGAVLGSISSLNQTGTISGGFGDLVDGLDVLKRPDLVALVYRAVIEFTKNKTSLDYKDLNAVTGLIVKRFAKADDRTDLLDYLMNSGRQIAIIQNSNQDIPKLTPDEILSVYMLFAGHLRPFVQSEMLYRKAALDQVIQEIASVTQSDYVSDPLFNASPIEKQLEDARKTVGSKERDAKLAKIASWLMRQNGKDASYFKLAGDVVDEISDVELRNKYRDFIKLVSIEKFVSEKDYSGAEKTARSLTSSELKTWAYMALGTVQKSNVAASLDLYENSQTFLKKSKPTHYRTQLALLLSSLLVKNNETLALEILTDAGKYSEMVEALDEKGDLNLRFHSNIGEMSFDAGDLFTDLDSVFVPGELGKLAAGHWDDVASISTQVRPISLQLDMKLLMAKSALEYLKQSNKNSHDTPKNP